MADEERCWVMKMANGNWRSWLVVLLVVGWGAANHAQGDTFSVELPEFIGDLIPDLNEPCAVFDFGHTFLTINEVRIELSGTFTAGLARGDGITWSVDDTMVLMPEIVIYMPAPGSGFAYNSLFPTESPFSIDEIIVPRVGATWDHLMGGVGEVTAEFSSGGGWGWDIEVVPTVQITAAQLVIDGTVPEPGTIVLLGMGGMALLRRKRQRGKR